MNEENVVATLGLVISSRDIKLNAAERRYVKKSARMFHGCPIIERVDDDHQNCDENIQITNMTVPVHEHDHRIDMCDLNRSFLESMVMGGTASQSATSSSKQSEVEERLSETQSEDDDKFEILSDIEENSDLRDSIDLNDRLSEHILASITGKRSSKVLPIVKKAAKAAQEASDTPATSPNSAITTRSVPDTPTTEDAEDKPSQKSEELEVSASNRQEMDAPPSGAGKNLERESLRESVAKKRAQMKMLAQESVAAKRAKAMLKFQEAGKGPCLSENCRNRGSFESEEQELDRLLKIEEEREAKLRERPDKCIGFQQRQFDKTAFKPSLYMNLYKEPITVRRVRRKPAKPAAAKTQSKPNKTSDLRYKYLHNQKVVSSNAAEHIKKFKRPPFKNPSKYGHTCRDPPAHFALQREQRIFEMQVKKSQEQGKQMLQSRPAEPGSASASRSAAVGK